jgi:hypothetical protein
MNRRNLLLSIGTAAVGSGAVLGSGALTSVEADRTLNVGVDPDSTAALALSANSSISGVTNGGGASGTELSINLADDINDEAVTTYGVINDGGDDDLTDTDNQIADGDEAFSVTNNSGESVDLSVSMGTTTAGFENLVTMYADGSPASTGSVSDITTGSITLAAGDHANVAIQIDTENDTDDTAAAEDLTVTFSATASDGL